MHYLNLFVYTLCTVTSQYSTWGSDFVGGAQTDMKARGVTGKWKRHVIHTVTKRIEHNNDCAEEKIYTGDLQRL